MINQLSEKVVLITGASSGIGEATAMLLNKEGCRVYGAARRLEKMEHLQALGIRVIKMDMTKDDQIVAGVETIIKEQGKIDILVNNAGYGSYGAIEDVPLEEARRQFEVNIFGLARLCQLVLPHMRRNNYGKIVNISSMGGKLYAPLGGWYHATKYALEGLSDCMRMETKEFGIDVIIIEPGIIKSEWGDIAIDSMVKTSGSTSYSKLAQAAAKLFKKAYAHPRSSPPDVIAQVILKAVTSKRPKTRYVAGHMARTYLFFRKMLSDKIFDKMMLLAVKQV